MAGQSSLGKEPPRSVDVPRYALTPKQRITEVEHASCLREQSLPTVNQRVLVGHDSVEQFTYEDLHGASLHMCKSAWHGTASYGEQQLRQ